jgi:hypothetical protein
MGNILIGSIPGVWIGTMFIDRVPAHALRVTLGAVLLGSALAVVGKAGIHVPVVAIMGAPVAIGAVAFLLHRWRGAAPTAAAASAGAALGAVEGS